MKALPVAAWVVIASGLALGVAGDTLLRAPGAPGLNLFVWTAGLVAAGVLLHRRGGGKLSAEAGALLGVGLLFVATLMGRDAAALKLLSLGCATVAFALPALHAGAAWIRRGGVVRYAGAVAGAAAHAAGGAALVLGAVDWGTLRAAPGRHSGWRHAAGAARGAAIVAPFVVIFGALFISADAVFAGIVADAVYVDLEVLASHFLLIGFLSWVSMGALRGFLAGTRIDIPGEFAARRPALGIMETAVALALLDLLFLGFVIVQFRYLFGGSTLVEVTPGLTYAEYARRGFFELVVAAALILPLLLAADGLLRRDRPRDEHIFRALTGIQIVLVFAVMASAVQRLRLYQEAYGLTELRLYATALLVLLAVVLLWFAITILRGTRTSFAFGTLCATLLTVAVLHAANPDAIIARTNIARAATAAVTDPRFDVAYATSLSADAVPVLLAALPTLPADTRCTVARRLLHRWPPEERTALRSWSWSSDRARREVRGNERLLREFAGSGDEC
jgi:hypothetical protein